MRRVLLVDDHAHTRELFSDVLRARLGAEVVVRSRPAEVDADLIGTPFDAAVIGLAFAAVHHTGLDAMLRLHLEAPTVRLVPLGNGDAWSGELLRDAWEALPLATAICTTSPVAAQVDLVAQVLAAGDAPFDPALQMLLPAQRSPWRTLEGYSRLVQHRGHAKLWEALLACGPHAEYQDLAAFSGLRLNALRNYRAQLLPELVLHGLHNPPMRDLYQFALRCRPFLAPFVERRGHRLEVAEATG